MGRVYQRETPMNSIKTPLAIVVGGMLAFLRAPMQFQVNP
jgi:hypothetical protein